MDASGRPYAKRRRGLRRSLRHSTDYNNLLSKLVKTLAFSHRGDGAQSTTIRSLICLLIYLMHAVADPEIWNRGRKGEGGVWNFSKILGKNNAFSCKIFTCFKMHPDNRGDSRFPPP